MSNRSRIRYFIFKSDYIKIVHIRIQIHTSSILIEPFLTSLDSNLSKPIFIGALIFLDKIFFNSNTLIKCPRVFLKGIKCRKLENTNINYIKQRKSTWRVNINPNFYWKN